MGLRMSLMKWKCEEMSFKKQMALERQERATEQAPLEEQSGSFEPWETASKDSSLPGLAVWEPAPENPVDDQILPKLGVGLRINKVEGFQES